jgi:hypothetical protein
LVDLPEHFLDDPEIVGEAKLLRRVPEFLVHDGVIESSVFDERSQGCGLSMTIWHGPTDIEDVLRGHDGFGLVCVKAGELRDKGALIVRHPLVGNLNHCEIFPRLSGGARKKLKKAAKWVLYPDWVLPEHRKDIEHNTST